MQSPTDMDDVMWAESKDAIHRHVTVTRLIREIKLLGSLARLMGRMKHTRICTVAQLDAVSDLRKALREALDAVASETSSPPISPQPLLYATCVVQCNFCKVQGSYHDVMAHDCHSDRH